MIALCSAYREVLVGISLWEQVVNVLVRRLGVRLCFLDHVDGVGKIVGVEGSGL